jgi:hypothetical protein
VNSAPRQLEGNTLSHSCSCPLLSRTGLLGSFEPFPKTRAEGERTGDGRKSIEERYAGREDYLKHVKQAADDLVRQRFLLAGDVTSVLRRAGQMWNAFTGGN